MTLTDDFYFRGKWYKITRTETPLPVDPWRFGIVPGGCIPGFDRLWYGSYQVKEGVLNLRALYVAAMGTLPDIDGVAAEANREDFFFGAMRVYRSLDRVIHYTGSFFIGLNPVDIFLENAADSLWYACQDVYLLTFKKGILTRVADFSKDMAVLRQKMLADPGFYVYDPEKKRLTRSRAYQEPFRMNWQAKRLDIIEKDTEQAVE